ncbi:hypothetical protein, partial [Escherichia coli]|uniref:hypothetical protein n=1 Tax=Escherichia coli TaxID=562 RepID=UPI0013D2D9EE
MFDLEFHIERATRAARIGARVIGDGHHLPLASVYKITEQVAAISLAEGGLAGQDPRVTTILAGSERHGVEQG